MARREKKAKKKEEVPGPEVPSITALLKGVIGKRDAKHVEKYASSVVAKFGRYIKSMAIFGSFATKVKRRRTSDIDVAIVVDDTDVRRMTRPELKEKLFQRLCEMAFPISKRIHPQPYLLTEFWEYLREGNPVLLDIMRTAIPIYDTGFFLPVQMLMKAGAIKPSKEAIDKHIFVSGELLKLVRDTLTHKLTYDLEQAVVSSSQAVLMELGYRPPAPNEVPKFVREVLVEKEKVIERKYADYVEQIIEMYKDIEHKRKRKMSGRELDKYYQMTQEYVERMKRILKELRGKRGEKWLFEAFERLERVPVKRDGMIRLEREEKLEERREELIKKKLGRRE
jgi:predicted nucleotidyltransferase